jgi:4-hydroxymandelate oxidase
VKGILDTDDAARCVDHGAGALVVSAHGGRQLDSLLTAIEALPDIAMRVGDAIDVLVDGGFREGTDLIKALALGARAVLIGRPVYWGLAAGGRPGVRAVLETLRHELELAMITCGAPTIDVIRRDLVILDSPLVGSLAPGGGLRS